MYTTTTTFLTTIALISSAMAQGTYSVQPISQISDGQIQGPTGTGAPIPLPSVIHTSSSIPYENPFTIYTTQTNSLGIITGMPAVATSIPSQPAVVTSQPISPTLPHYSGYVYGTETSTSSSVAAPSTLSTSVVGSSAGGSSTGSTTASVTLAQSTGGAAMNRVAGAGVALVVLGLGFSLL